MTTLLGVLVFIVALLASVMLHEAGHFVTARRYGMKATQFFLGFGPTLFSRRRGETEYGVKAIPAGGFVKIVGMTPLEEVDPADEPRAFYRQPPGRWAIVLAAGSVMHFVLAVLLVVGVTFAVGRITEAPPVLSAPSDCVDVTEENRADNPCAAPGAVPAPAKQAGLREGDIVVAANGVPIDDRDDLITALRTSPEVPVALEVLRDGQRVPISVTPFPVTRKSLVDETQTERVGAVGVAVRGRVVTERVGPVAALQESGDLLWLSIRGIGETVTEKLGTIATLYDDNRDPEGFVGLIGASRISGEVVASDETAGVRAVAIVGLVAGLNLFVGVFNLLPLLPLDGGHLAVLGYEQARHRLRRLRGYRGEVQPVDMTKLLPLTYVVALAFIGLTLYIAGADIVNPIRLGG